MSGTITGGRKAAETNRKLHGDDFYARRGQNGGQKSTKGGFASTKKGKDGLTGSERAKIAGKKGGTISRRGPAKKHKNEMTTQENINLWQRLFRGGKTVIKTDDENA